jgi:hypothetical protein
MKGITHIVVLFVASITTAFSQNNTFRLWGTAGSFDGLPGNGIIFNMNPDGTDYQVAKEFKQNIDGAQPRQGLILASDGFLYGALKQGGIHDMGVIYRMYADGTNFTKVLEFSPDTGFGPLSQLTEADDGRLYAVVASADHATPPPGNDIIFSVNKDGSDFKVVYHFDGDVRPTGKVLIGSDNFLYGGTSIGGDHGYGFLYRVAKDGTGFQVIRSMDGDHVSTNGNGLIEGDDGKIYGALQVTGLFRLNKDGSDFEMIHEFSDEEGTEDAGFIMIPGGKMIGATWFKGPLGFGSLYSVNSDGSGYARIHDFEAYLSSGIVLSSDGKVRGTVITRIFEIDTDGNNYHESLFDAQVNGVSFVPNTLESSPGKFISVSASGPSQNGMIYSVESNGTFSILKDFPIGAAEPASDLVIGSDGYVYGTTWGGGPSGNGLIFKMKKDGTDYQEIYTFDQETVLDVHRPVVEYNDVLIGSNGRGVYQINKDGSNFTYIYDSYSDTEHPVGKLIIDNGFVFGVTGGINFSTPGTFYKLEIATGQRSVLYDLTSTADELGSSPINVGRLGADRFVIANIHGGSKGGGTIMSIRNDGGDAKKLLDLDENDGIANTENIPLLASDGRLYGNSYSFNYLYSMNVDGTDLVKYKVDGVTIPNGGSAIEPTPGELYFTGYGNVGRFKMATSETTFFDEPNSFTRATLLAVTKQPQHITMDAIGTKTVDDAPFSLSAISDLDLPITYTSSNSDVATVEGNTVTIVGSGTTVITAYQAGTITVSDASAELTLTVLKRDQAITFDPIADKDFATTSFTLEATASSNLDVVFTTTSDKITIADSKVTFVKPGRVTIDATQPGDSKYNPAASVQQSFCINPAKPKISLSGAATLISSNDDGNQWYLNNTIIDGATGKSYSATQDGVYVVTTKVDDCATATSEQITFVGLKDEDDSSVSVYPNPAGDELFIKTTGFYRLTIIDVTSRVVGSKAANADVPIDVRYLSSGVYFLRLEVDGKSIVRRFTKL